MICSKSTYVRDGQKVRSEMITSAGKYMHSDLVTLPTRHYMKHYNSIEFTLVPIVYLQLKVAYLSVCNILFLRLIHVV